MALMSHGPDSRRYMIALTLIGLALGLTGLVYILIGLLELPNLRIGLALVSVSYILLRIVFNTQEGTS